MLSYARFNATETCRQVCPFTYILVLSIGFHRFRIWFPCVGKCAGHWHAVQQSLVGRRTQIFLLQASTRGLVHREVVLHVFRLDCPGIPKHGLLPPGNLLDLRILFDRDDRIGLWGSSGDVAALKGRDILVPFLWLVHGDTPHRDRLPLASLR